VQYNDLEENSTQGVLRNLSFDISCDKWKGVKKKRQRAEGYTNTSFVIA